MITNPQVSPRILVTTDFSAASERAFFHALALTVRSEARLTLLHTRSDTSESVPWDQFPGVRETLTKWQMLPADTPRSAVGEKLNIGITKMVMRDDDPRQGIADYLRRHPVELLIMATEGRNGLARFFDASVAESVCHRTRSRTLLLPKSGQGFIDIEDGSSSLKRVLCAFDPDQDMRPNIAFLNHWLPMMATQRVEVTLLHSDADPAVETIVLADSDGVHWQRSAGTGDAAKRLLDAVGEDPPDLLVVNTEPRLGLRGRMHGSRLDRLLKAKGCPVLTLPLIGS